MTVRRDGDGDDGDGDDGDGDDGETETAEMAMTSWKGGGRRQKRLQARLGTYFSQPVQHGSGHTSSGLLGTC